MTQLITWTLTGIVAGWLARRLLRSNTGAGVTGDLVTGWLGGLLGGWLFRSIGFTGPDHIVAHVVVAVVGAVVLIGASRLVTHAMAMAGATTRGVPFAAASLEDGIRVLGEFERRVLQSVLSRRPAVPDPNLNFDRGLTLGQRLADRVAQFGGSWTFIGLFGIVIVSWMALNENVSRPFDPYPFILLNLVLSCLAALQAPVIMMSQNRQAAKDRSDARTDYEVNVRAEMEIMALHTKLDLLREQEWMRLLGVVERQQACLERIETRLEGIERHGDRS